MDTYIHLWNRHLLQVNVFALPVVDAGPPQSFCIDAGTQQLTGLPLGGNWSGNAVSSAGLFDPQLAGSGSFTIFYNYKP